MAELTLVPLLAQRIALLDDVPGSPSQPMSREEFERVLAFFAPVPGYAAPAARTSTHRVDGPHGQVPVRVYQPADGRRPRHGLVWMHGGAFIAGDLDMPEADVLARELVARLDFAIVSVDYHLCRDGIHFPIPHDDVHAAYQWARRAGLVPPAAPWAIGGASAGANLAAGVCQRLRDGGMTPAAQVLIYPVLHPATPAGPSEFDAAVASLPPYLRADPESRDFLDSNYLGGLPASAPYAFPGVGALTGSPRTFVSVCEWDGLRHSGESYAADLVSAGVSVESELVRGVVHGHLNLSGLQEALQTIARIAAFLDADPSVIQ